MSNKKLMLTEKDKDDLLKLHIGKWPGDKAYERLTKAAREGGFDYSDTDRKLDELLNKVYKKIEKSRKNGSR